MRKFTVLCSLCFTGVFLAQALEAAPQALCALWQASSTSPHSTYDGASITLKGIARGTFTEYRWRLRRHGGTSWTAITNILQPRGQACLYRARRPAIRGDAPRAGRRTCREHRHLSVRIYESTDLAIPAHLDIRVTCRLTMDCVLHTQMVRSTFGRREPRLRAALRVLDPSYFPLAASRNGDRRLPDQWTQGHRRLRRDPYVETVRRAMNYLLYCTQSRAISVQSAGNPDTNGNGIGLVANQRRVQPRDVHRRHLLRGPRQQRRAELCRSGRIRQHLWEDDQGHRPGHGRLLRMGASGLRVRRRRLALLCNYSESDMSTTQWPPSDVSSPGKRWGCTIPAFVSRSWSVPRLHPQPRLNTTMEVRVRRRRSVLNITKTAAGIIWPCAHQPDAERDTRGEASEARCLPRELQDPEGPRFHLPSLERHRDLLGLHEAAWEQLRHVRRS